MLNLPTTVLNYLLTTIFADRSLAYLFVSKAGILEDWGGKLSNYGITHLQRGALIESQVFFLEGMLPLDDADVYLPGMKTDHSLSADIYLVPDRTGDWVLLLDATLDELQQSLIQQYCNDLSLLKHSHAQLLNQQSKTSATTELFAAFNQVILERIDATVFHLVGTLPDWVKAFAIPNNSLQNREALEQVFPFLGHFLVDADRFWQSNERGILKSGFWNEVDQFQQEHPLEAMAVCLSRKHFLVIERSAEAYQEKHALIQASREQKLTYDRFSQEVQSKEILLHCIFHEFAGEIATLSGCLELLSSEALSEQGQALVNISRSQVHQQTELLQNMLKAFSTEIAALKAPITSEAQPPNLLDCLRTVVEAFAPSFVMRQRQLQVNLDRSGQWEVVGERDRLEQVLSNLLENALRQTPENSTVAIQLEAEPDFITCAVVDQGSSPPSDSQASFQKFLYSAEAGSKTGLGLYFCQMTIEHWGGTIGYAPQAGGGARFWFRLPRPKRSARRLN